MVPERMRRLISSVSALAHASRSGPRLAELHVSGLPLVSRLRVSRKSLGLPMESCPENWTFALRALWARSSRRSSLELFAGRRSRVGGALRGGRRMARKGLYSSMGWRRSSGRVSRSGSVAGGLVLADGPCADLSRRIHVRTSLTLATKVSCVFDDEICIVFQRMLLSSSKVSVPMTVQGPSVFS